MYSVEINHLTKRYKDFALEDVSFCVQKGSIIGLVGENGAGKSTTINAILGVCDYDEGEIKVFDKNNREDSFLASRQDIGAVIDGASFPESLTPNNIKSILKSTYQNFDGELFDSYLQRFNLNAAKRLKDLSRGMKMKFSITAALSHRPRLLVLDEATSGLDPLIRDDILDILNEFTRQEENSVLFSSHIVSDLEKICDYIVFIHEGRIVLFEEKDTLMERYAILKTARIEDIPTEAIVSKKRSDYGYELLIKRGEVSKAFVTEVTTLEDIIIFLSKH